MSKDLALKDSNGREQLHRGADEDRHRVQELDCVDELAALGEVVDDLDLRVLSKGGIAQRADRGEDDRDDDHDEPEEPLEALRLGHGRLDGKDQADALEREDGGANHQRVLFRVEQDDRLVDAVGREGRDVVLVDVSETKENAHIGQQGDGAKLGNVADPGERHQNNHLDRYQGANGQRAASVGDGGEKGQNVLGHKDDAGADEAQLRQGDGPEDEVAHALAGNGVAQLSVAPAHLLLALEQQVEGHHGDGRHGDHGDGREEDAAIVERARQEHDACADKGLDQGEEGLGGAGVGGARGSRGAGIGAAAEQRCPLVGLALLFVGYGLLVRVGKILAGKVSVEIEKLDKVPCNGQPGRHEVVAAGLAQKGPTEAARDELVADRQAVGVGGELSGSMEGRGALVHLVADAGIELEEVAVHVAALQLQRRFACRRGGSGGVSRRRRISTCRGAAIELGGVAGRQVVGYDFGFAWPLVGRG